MNSDFDDTLLDDDDVDSDIDAEDERVSAKSLDARRRIERRQELKRLQTMLDDPDYYYDFE
ncbi:MAG: hypothetical protein P8171_05735 [Candidatus Thiodiazotropha sp.]|jgi:hypothetical protein